MTVADTEDDRCATKRRWRSDEQRSVPVEVGRREYVTYFKIAMESLMGRDIGHSSRVGSGLWVNDARSEATCRRKHPVRAIRRLQTPSASDRGTRGCLPSLKGSEGDFSGALPDTRESQRPMSVTQPAVRAVSRQICGVTVRPRTPRGLNRSTTVHRAEAVARDQCQRRSWRMCRHRASAT